MTLIYAATEHENETVGDIARLVARGETSAALELARSFLADVARYDYGDGDEEIDLQAHLSDLLIVGQHVEGCGSYSMALYGANAEAHVVVVRD